MSEITTGQIDKKTETKDQVLELDVREWFKNPITKIYMDILNQVGEDQKAELVNYLDENLSLSGEEMKSHIHANHSARELLKSITDKESVIYDFKENDYLIKEDESNDE